MTSRAKRKGNSLEKDVCRVLSAWCYPKRYPNGCEKERADSLPFRRTPSSGGWSRSSEARGDILCPKFFPLSIECKNTEKWTWDNVARNAPGGSYLDGFWKQCLRDAEKAKKEPCLIFSRNFDEIYVRFCGERAELVRSVMQEHAPVLGGVRTTRLPRVIIHGVYYFLLNDVVRLPWKRVLSTKE